MSTTEETKIVPQAPQVAPTPARMQLTQVKAAFHLIIQPTKLFEDTDPDRVTLFLDGREALVHVMNPFDSVKVVTPDAANPMVEVPGYLRACLVPALRVVSDFNSAADAGIMRIGTAKETDQLYKDMAFQLLNKVEAVMPDVSNLFTKQVAIRKTEQSNASFTWTIDVYAFYQYKGAVVEDVTPYFSVIQNLVDGVSGKGKPSKAGPIPNTNLTLSLAVDMNEGFMLAAPSTDLSALTFSTTQGESPVMPNTKVGKSALFGSRGDNPRPMMLFTKV